MTKVESKLATLVAGVLLVCFVFAPAAQAEEGMWTFNNFPSKAVGEKYGFTPSQAWLDHVRLASLRIAGGCSASFISPQGLVMTNHHCVVECVEQLSTAQQNYEENGYIAHSPAEEKKCPDFELDQLIEIRDVTTDVQEALSGKTGDAANKALNAKRAELEQSCGSDASIRCDLVSLYHGGVYNLYRYKRYDDVRLVFAPEFSVAQFGGDPDNFNFPRFDFDIGLLRAYEGGKPAESRDYLHWSANGTKDGDLVFVSGNPGGTFRQLTNSQMAFERDTLYPFRLPEVSELRGQLEVFMTRGPEQAREAKDDLFFWRTASRFTSDGNRRCWIRNLSGPNCRKSNGCAPPRPRIPSWPSMFQPGTTSPKSSNCARNSMCATQPWEAFPTARLCLGMRSHWCAPRPSARNPTGNACRSIPTKR